LGVPGNSINMNVGKMYNQGFEFSVGGNVISNDNFVWNTNFNATFVKNEIQTLVDGNDITYTYHVNREGESIGSFFGYEYYGVNPENGNAIFKTDKNELVQNVAGTTTYRKYDPTNPTDVSVAASLGDKQILGKSLPRSEEHTSELQSRENLVCRLLLEKKK